ncbi:MAG: hypothetical protein K2X99_04000 [Gemmatimonadaceae bacterium]|nr:hypothetical protein [Gemmatimonadaceae bacterium]
MYVSFALFADAANLSQEGKLNILGVFDALQVAAVPAVHPRATLVVRLKAEPDDGGVHSLAFAWTNPDGEELWSSSGEVEVGTPPPGTFEVDIPIVASIDLPVAASGTHLMRVMLDGELRAEVALHVRVGTALGAPIAAPGVLLS